MPKTKEKEGIDYNALKAEAVAAIKDKYGNVNKFAYSDDGKKASETLGIKIEYIKMYLTPKGPTSFKFMQYLFSTLGLGKLEKKVVVQKTTTYYKV